MLAAAAGTAALVTASAQGSTVHSAASGFRLGGAPGALGKQCKKAGSKASFPVLCPSKFIKGVDVLSGGKRSSAANAFWYDVEFTGLGRSGSEHVVFGAQKKPLTLPTGKGTVKSSALGAASRLHLPARMTVTGTTTVGGQPAILVRMPAKKAGRYAYHRAVLWNVANGGGEIVSIGLEAEKPAKRIATAKGLAAALK